MDLEAMKEVIAEVLQIDPSEITPDKDFEKDLGADSLDRVEIVMNIEDKFNIQIPDEDLDGIVTVGDAIEKISGLL